MAEIRYGHRVNTLMIAASDSDVQFAEAYRVVVYKPGTVVTSATGSVFTVPEGHGFVADDYFMVNPGTDDAVGVVSSVTSTTITTGSALKTPSAGDILVNLGPDTGATSSLQYDGSDVTIYSEENGTAITDSEITVDSEGGYEYWTQQRRLWELILDSNLDPVTVIRDVVPQLSGVGSPATLTVDSATPSVKGGTCFQTANTSATITDFTDGEEGQEIFVILDANTIIDFSTGVNIIGNAGVNLTAVAGDAIRCTHVAGVWYCTVISA